MEHFMPWYLQEQLVLFGQEDLIVTNMWIRLYLVKLQLQIYSFQAILGGTIQVPTLSGDVVVKVCLKLHIAFFLV